jgi:nucleoside 2-deoxyribosyltransferase
MKIYCAGPIRGDRSYAKFFQEIISLIQKMGHTALSELAPQDDEKVAKDDGMIYRRDIHWLGQSEALVAEVSAPSLGVGYEISYALHVRKIPVLALCHHSTRSLSAMISGNFSELLVLETYENVEELEKKLREFLAGCDSST